MATVTSEVTIDTSEWIYIGVDGVPHTVTNAETFNLTIENTASNIMWEVLPGQTVATDDGYVLTFRPSVDGGNKSRQIRVMALADATMSRVVGGELRMSLSDSNVEQIWKFAQFYASNVDVNAAGTIGANTAATQCKLEDQFGNVMYLPTGLVAGITAGTAAA